MFGFFGDFIRFLGAVITGSKDSSREFIEALDMAERYLRWGNQRKDLRDYLATFRALEDSPDSIAPKADLLARKYRIFAKAVAGYTEVRIEMYKQQVEGLMEMRNQLLAEEKVDTLQVQASEERLGELRRQLSMYTAKEEERVLNELKVHHDSITKQVDSNEAAFMINNGYDEMVTEIERLCQLAESQVANLEMHQQLKESDIEAVRKSVWQEMEAVRALVRAAQPDPVE